MHCAATLTLNAAIKRCVLTYAAFIYFIECLYSYY
ncbi:hypothetical protein VPHK567_0429 [Vibrio phage K567]